MQNIQISLFPITYFRKKTMSLIMNSVRCIRYFSYLMCRQEWYYGQSQNFRTFVILTHLGPGKHYHLFAKM